jgi:hypothetical protein
MTATREESLVGGTPEARFAEIADDPITRAQQVVGLVPPSGGGVVRRIAIAVAITWLPLAAYALWERRFLPGSVPEPLMQHFGIHARLLVALPMLIAAEATLRTSLRAALPQFAGRGLVQDDQLPRFRAILDRAIALRSSRVALAVMLALVAVATAYGWAHTDSQHELAWEESSGQPGFHFGVAWFSFVARPIFLLALLAWIWRLAVVGWGLSQIARLDLTLVATHPDRAGGLGFLERLPAGLAPVFFAVSVPIAARWGHDAMYHGLDVNTLRAPALLLIAVNVALAAAPLLAFAPALRATRRRALAQWGALLAEHGHLVERRWIGRETLGDDALLSAPELGPVADTNALYETVSGMRAVPISRATLATPIAATVLPLLPVAATQIPLGEIAKKLLAGLVGI